MNKTITLEDFKKLLQKTKALYIYDERWFIQKYKEKEDFLFIESRGYGINFRNSENESIEYFTHTDSFGEHTIFRLKSEHDGFIRITLCLPLYYTESL
jgi:hypothetical protein